MSNKESDNILSPQAVTERTVAELSLEDMIDVAMNAEPKTLSYWRLQNNEIVNALHEFAGADAWNDQDAEDDDRFRNDLLSKVLWLFNQLNDAMARQEQRTTITEVDGDGAPNAARMDTRKSVNVVFGGKHPERQLLDPTMSNCSISEQLIMKLAEPESSSSKIFTVSRSPVDIAAIPSHVIHMVKNKLDVEPEKTDEGLGGDGVQEFVDVFKIAMHEWETINKLSIDEHSIPSKFVAFFTLGQHKGSNPFQRNIYAAQNFAQALQTTLLPRILSLQEKQGSSFSFVSMDWRIVITGTDATKPSTSKDPVATLVEYDDTDKTNKVLDEITLSIPTYKVMEYNYVYAMSKLGQYHIIANAIANILIKVMEEAVDPDRSTKVAKDETTSSSMLSMASSSYVTAIKKIRDETKRVSEKIVANVMAAGDDGNYRPPSNDDPDKDNFITMEELDEISKYWDNTIEPTLSQYLWVAKDISICYTALHAKPWTEQALAQTTPARLSNEIGSRSDHAKAYILQQIVPRMKNAISTTQAAMCHFPLPAK